jgi:hypothetical protein
MGFLGILEDKRAHNVPGTVILDEAATQTHLDSALKDGTGKYSHTVLAPQPSDDPNDPLKFPLRKKILMLTVTALGTTIFGGTRGPRLNADLSEIAQDLQVSITKVFLASGY